MMMDELLGAVEQRAKIEPPLVRPTRRHWRLTDRLTEVVLDEIRRRYREGTPKAQLAAEYKIGLTSVKRVIRAKPPQ